MRISLQLLAIIAVVYPAAWFGGLYARPFLVPGTAPEKTTRPEDSAVGLHDIPTAVHPDGRGPQIADQSTLQDADASFFRGHWEVAKRQYEALAANWDGRLPDAVALRIAVAAEAVGQLDQALDEYQRLSQESDSAVIAASAKLGQARVWHELGRGANARQGLWTLLLQQEAYGDWAEECLAEATHRLAHQLKHEASRSEPTDLLDPMAVVSAPNPRAMTEVLGWLLEHSEAAPSDGDDPAAEPSEPQTAAFSSRRLGPTVDELYVTVRLGRIGLLTLLERLAAEADIPIVVSVTARDCLVDYNLPLDVRELKLTILLDGLADLRQLVWTVVEDRIEIHCRNEVGEDAISSFFAQAADRMIRRAITTFPGHHLAAASSWAMADLLFARTDFESAVRRYQRLLDEFPRLDGRAGAHFNLAKSLLADGRTDAALRAFFHAVDHGVGDLVEPVAYLYAGRLLIEDDQLARATRPLGRSLALANSNRLRAESVLALASLHLLNGNPHAANQALMEHRPVLVIEPYRDQAAFLAALARYQAASSSTEQDRSARGLLEALSHVSPDNFWGAYGALLTATAYRELSLYGPANSILIQGASDGNLGTIRERMLFELARNHYRCGDLQPCMEVLRELILGRRSRWSDRAELLLVQSEFDAGNDETCLRLCRELLRSSTVPATRAALLAMMGRVYQRQGKHVEAAMCFTGHLPTVDADISVQAEEREPVDALAPRKGRQDVGRT
ncbi:MAG: hypothetical protein EA424_08270 [Planctomycetaceae bacterium]|nr:MAG: hypothetical protein EA424_08270 [Planctomycetaceae bacterium]